jgi:hypothetical protein
MITRVSNGYQLQVFKLAFVMLVKGFNRNNAIKFKNLSVQCSSVEVNIFEYDVDSLIISDKDINIKTP